MIVTGRPVNTGDAGRARCLSIHTGYGCRHTGACCTAGWHIPAEPPVVDAIRRHFAAAERPRLFEAADVQEGQTILATGEDGACVFFDAARGRTCTIHGELGEHLLPTACRNFPRVTLSDPRGTWITLSHFCPTAAHLLFARTPLAIVPAPSTISLRGAAEGLDATAALPPLLRPGMLMDFDGYDAWERTCVDLLDTAGPDADAALAAIHGATLEIRQWSPGAESLRDCVVRILRGSRCAGNPDETAADKRRQALAAMSVPRGLATPDSTTGPDANLDAAIAVWHEFDGVIRRYLASKLFASWWPYLGLELIAVVEAIRVHRAVLRANIARRLDGPGTGREILFEAIRDTDLLMVHLSDSRELARLIARNL